jgi:hypothetical protein
MLLRQKCFLSASHCEFKTIFIYHSIIMQTTQINQEIIVQPKILPRINDEHLLVALSFLVMSLSSIVLSNPPM